MDISGWNWKLFVFCIAMPRCQWECLCYLRRPWDGVPMALPIWLDPFIHGIFKNWMYDHVKSCNVCCQWSWHELPAESLILEEVIQPRKKATKNAQFLRCSSKKIQPGTFIVGMSWPKSDRWKGWRRQRWYTSSLLCCGRIEAGAPVNCCDLLWIL